MSSKSAGPPPRGAALVEPLIAVSGPEPVQACAVGRVEPAPLGLSTQLGPANDEEVYTRLHKAATAHGRISTDMIDSPTGVWVIRPGPS
jgi:hypothetical protein